MNRNEGTGTPPATTGTDNPHTGHVNTGHANTGHINGQNTTENANTENANTDNASTENASPQMTAQTSNPSPASGASSDSVVSGRRAAAGSGGGAMSSWFLPVQLLLLALVVLGPWWRSQQLSPRPYQLSLQNSPTRVAPEYDYPLVVTDQQLAEVLVKLRPRLAERQPRINHVDHALRFWGVEATFDDPACLSGEQMRTLLTDHAAFRNSWGKRTRPLLLSEDGGIAFRTQQGAATASHVDHTLGTLAECGTPLDFPLRTPAGSGTVRDALLHAARSFNINQREYEWTILVLALYVGDGTPWVTAEGERLDFNRLARRLMRQHYVQGVCFGNHRLFTLAMLLRIDQQKPLLDDATNQAIRDHLTEATRRLVSAQAPEGYWDRNWFDPQADPNDSSMDDPLARRLLATGHALEWWAMAPAELHPPREVLVRAGQWLVREVEQLDPATVDKNYTFLSHVGRALVLWRGEFPAAAWTRLAPAIPTATDAVKPEPEPAAPDEPAP